jgi:hypothetical protein
MQDLLDHEDDDLDFIFEERVKILAKSAIR